MNTNPALKKFDIRLSEFERRMEEDGYDSTYEDFGLRLFELEDKLEELSVDNTNKEDLITIKAFQKRLDTIKKDEDLYDEDGERDMMFPDGEDD